MCISNPSVCVLSFVNVHMSSYIYRIPSQFGWIWISLLTLKQFTYKLPMLFRFYLVADRDTNCFALSVYALRDGAVNDSLCLFALLTGCKVFLTVIVLK